MKGLYRYLSPFAPDQSGAVSALYELGGILVICDAGGCAGNVCGFDEPRWFTQKSAVFSAGIRDMDAIMGRDDRLMQKIGDAVSQMDAAFVALIGTPVPAVIGTDLAALGKLARRRFGLPVLAVDTTGMELYDKGQEKAWLSLLEAFARPEPDAARAPALCVWGATPLDLPGENAGERLAQRLSALGFGRAACAGYGAGLADVENAGAARCNLVVSPSGLAPAKWLQKRFGTPYLAGLPLAERGLAELKGAIAAEIAGAPRSRAQNGAGEPVPGEKKPGGVLLLHQQVLADALRRELAARGFSGRADIAGWFAQAPELARPGDRALRAEGDLAALVSERGYAAVAGDPLYRRALPDFTGVYVELPHYAVSSGIFPEPETETVIQKLLEAAGAGQNGKGGAAPC